MTDIRKWDYGRAAPVKSGTRKPKESKDELKSKYYPSSRARENVIPSPDQLSRLIDKALTALSKGVFWDRGSIINIVL